jgi:hypothetical protein
MVGLLWYNEAKEGCHMEKKPYDPARTAHDVLAVLRKHNTPLALVDSVFEWTHKLIKQEVVLQTKESGEQNHA